MRRSWDKPRRACARSNPAQTIYSIKRFIGLRGDELREDDADVSYAIERRERAAGSRHRKRPAVILPKKFPR